MRLDLYANGYRYILSIHVSAHMDLHSLMHLSIYSFTCYNAYIYVQISAYTYANAHIHIHIYIYMRINNCTFIHIYIVYTHMHISDLIRSDQVRSTRRLTDVDCLMSCSPHRRIDVTRLHECPLGSYAAFASNIGA